MSQESPDNPNDQAPADQSLSDQSDQTLTEPVKDAGAPGLKGSESENPGLGSADDDPPGIVQMLRRADNAVGTLEQALLVVFLLALIITGATQAIAMRLNIVLGYWTADVIRYSVFFIAMAGAALSAHTGQLIAMDFVTRMLDRRPRAYLQIVLRLFTIGMCMLLVVYGLNVAEFASSDGTIPPNQGLLALPIGAGVMAFHVAVHMIIDVIYLSSGQLPPEVGERSLH